MSAAAASMTVIADIDQGCALGQFERDQLRAWNRFNSSAEVAFFEEMNREPLLDELLVDPNH